MPDLDTSRMPRDKLLGLISSTAKECERITAPMPIPTLAELLGDEAPQPTADVVVRFTPHTPMMIASPSGVHLVERSHWIVAISIAAVVLLGSALIFLA